MFHHLIWNDTAFKTLEESIIDISNKGIKHDYFPKYYKYLENIKDLIWKSHWNNVGDPKMK